MDKRGRRLFVLALALAGALLASTAMLMFTTVQSWLAFVGWMVFFLALQSPFFFSSPGSRENCTAWLPRLRRKG